MSKERQRAREAREAARAAERERLAKQRAREQRVQKLRPSLPKRPQQRRPRRYGAMSVRLRLTLALGWLFVQFLVWQLVPDTRGRIGFAVASLIALPLAVVVIPWPRTWKAR